MAESAWKLKVGRASHHQRDLEAALREYSQLNPFGLVSKLEGNDLVVRVSMRQEIPEVLSLIVGDLLHNARSALDIVVMSAARDLASESGRQLSFAEERELFFPVTRSKPEFDRAARILGRYLSEETIIRIRIVQPWSMATAWLERENEQITADSMDMLISLDLLYRLNRLDNFDKHRQLLTVDFHPGSITLGDGEFDPIDQGRESEGEPVNLDELDPKIRANLIESLQKMQEQDERPDSYDFFFSAGELHDGAEIGRYIRHDHGQMPGDLTARGNLWLVLWEPGLTGRFPGAPLLQNTVREMIDEVESVCTFVESGVLGEGDTRR